MLFFSNPGTPNNMQYKHGKTQAKKKTTKHHDGTLHETAPGRPKQKGAVGKDSHSALPRHLALRWYGLGRHAADLLDQELALVDKLLVFGALLEEVGQEG